MNNIKTIDNEITTVKIGYLQSKLKTNLHSIKNLYKQIVLNLPSSVNEQVLYDNYYLIQKIAKTLLKENRRSIISIDNEMYPVLGKHILENCNKDAVPKTNELIYMFNTLSAKRYITNTEFELIVWQFRYAILLSLSRLYEKEVQTEKTALDLIILLTKSDTFNLKAITETCNPLEKIYRNEASGIYINMDDTTKKIYRNRTSFIATKHNKSELDIAAHYISVTNSAFYKKKSENETHIGFYIYEDYKKLTKKISFEFYLFLITFITSLMAAVFTFSLKSFVLWVFMFFPLWEFSKLLVDLIFTCGNEVTYLPRIELNKQIPKGSETLVVISTIISSAKDIICLQEKLIRLHFSNLSDNIRICALCDLKQSSLPVSPEDKAIIKNSQRMINKLNQIYCDKFVLVIRKRSYSDTQMNYMGYERKRGAIEQLVRYIKKENIEFSCLDGDVSFLHTTKYLVCIDFDTKTLMDTIPELVGIAMHPLNKPIIENGRVVKGYGIITPNMITKLKSSLKTPFAKLVGGIGSSCAYDTNCCNLYQDTFEQAVFSGKGLIDINSFYLLCCNLFLPERILSHDILEGEILRTAFAGDIEFSESFPSNALSYFKRQHRWIRGDIQNISFLRKNISAKNGLTPNPMNDISKFKLFDNIRRAFLPVNLVLLLILPFFYNTTVGLTLALLAVTSLLIPYIASFLSSVLHNGLYNIPRKYYSDVFSQTSEISAQGLLALLLLPQNAVYSLDAIVRSLWRLYVSKKKLLEWTTAAQAEKSNFSVLSFMQLYIIPEIVCITLLFSPVAFLKFIGFILLFTPFLMTYFNTPYKTKGFVISEEKELEVYSQLTAMWQFYEDYATEQEHYLPPDNVQFAPVYRVCHRTSPTNIGLMMLCTLIARDFDLIDSKGLYKRINRTLASVEQLEKYNGNLFNWYDTKTLKTSSNQFVSTVDSGNFVCCLVVLKEGLNEYKTQHSEIDNLINRINYLIDNTNISTFYDESKELFSIGYNPNTKEYSPNHYDLLMSEARMTSYFAIAKRQVPKKHWGKLGRTIARLGLYSGPVSYSGTMFEYFMPELLLTSQHGSLSYEGLNFCLYCQKKRAKDVDVPYGISESGYYAFDNALNYQYKAHGVQKIGLKKGLDNELVISPYSTYLVMQFDFASSFSNLENLKKYGMYGKYGFYEAIDFTASTNVKNGSIIKSYMAHHVGMSIVAVANALHNGIIQKRFLKDNFMKSSAELLEEKIISGTVMFDDFYRKPENQRPDSRENEKHYFESVQPSQPNIKLLCNGDYTLAVSDIGASIALYQGRDVYQRTTDTLRRPEGCYFAVSGINQSHTCLTYLPEYRNSDDMSVEFNENTVSFYSNTNELQIGMKVHLHNNLPCEIRQFAIKNTSSRVKNANLLSYIQPVLATFNDHAAHPAFSKLFLKENYDADNKVIIASRKNRHNDEQVFCAVGFVENVDMFINLSREEVLSCPDGVKSVFLNKENLIENGNSVPDPCIFIKTPLQLSPNEQKELNLFILMALSKDELYQNIAKIRYSKFVYTISTSTVPSNSIEGRLVNTILPQLLFKRFDCKEINNAIEENRLPASSLWGLGISGDLPVVIVNIDNLNSKERVTGYIKAQNILKLCGINFDLVFIFDDKGEYERAYYNNIISIVNILRFSDCISSSGGIHLVDISEMQNEIISLLYAIAVHIAPASMVRIQSPLPEFVPFKIMPVEKTKADIENRLISGGFNENEFVVDKKTELPWCNILANPAFGTMVSNNSLGFTYAVNSRENKLTPWDNDTRTDNRGELLLIKINNCYYDLISGSTSVFSPEKAVYYGITPLFDSTVTVSVAEKGMCKRIQLEIKLKSDAHDAMIAYYTEPVLGVTRDNSRMLVFSYADDVLFAKNPLNKDVNGYMAIKSSSKPSYYITNREAFLSGKWQENSISSTNNPCAALIIKPQAKADIIQKIDFYLSFGTTLHSAMIVPGLFKPFKADNKNSFSLNSPDKNLDNIFNTWLGWQALAGRIYARTGFYQNSGAWGFRDQLQDACACLLLKPEIARRQIARACTAQFAEGDVLHWWHKLPHNIMRGVRTKYSDDLVWLPYTVCEYIEKTGDYSFLGNNIAFCEGVELQNGEHEKYGEVHRSPLKESVYNHCKRALRYAYRLGEHNLILMGCGDWNDSFNNVGIEGRGESIWLSQFMAIVLKKFAEISEHVGDLQTNIDFVEKSQFLIKAVEDNCWDGEWYIRAYFDNGDELGSKNCAACQIDSLAQSFATLARFPNTERNLIALNSAYEYLVDKENGLIKLFTPPFKKNEMPVGYATSYPRGIRENGGQYTHGAIWLAIAFFEAGIKDKGFELINLLNPANKYLEKNKARIFKNEPYFMTADIYTNPQCYGRGGWSIYTGAAAWYYRAILEWFLGIKINNNAITFEPYLPDKWEEYEIEIEYFDTNFHVMVKRGQKNGMFDNDREFDSINFDGKNHEIRIVIEKQ